MNVDFDGMGGVDAPDAANAPPEAERERPKIKISAERLINIANSWRRRKGVESEWADALAAVVVGNAFADPLVEGGSRHDVILKLTGLIADEDLHIDPACLDDIFQRSLEAMGMGDRRGEVGKAYAWHVGKRSEAAASKIPQADELVSIAGAWRYFHGADGEPFATIETGGHVENLRVRGSRFRALLAHVMHKSKHKTPGSEAVRAAIETICGKALYDAPELSAHVRVAEHDGAIWIDLGDPAWQAVKVTAAGWDVVPSREVVPRFVRPKGLLPLPMPERGGDVEELSKFINVEPEDRVLVVAWLLAALRPPSFPYPILCLQGEQGNAKTSAARGLRSLVDPNDFDIRRKPKDTGDLMIAALHSHVIAYDNLSGISAELSDDLCSLATGAALGKRGLFTDAEEALLKAKRPIIVNGIDALAMRPDFAERAIVITLPRIAKRRTEREFGAAFNAAKAKIFGALLSLLVVGLKRIGDVKIPDLPRMADFAEWAEACLPKKGFLEKFGNVQRDAALDALESDPIAMAVIELVKAKKSWTGTATELLEQLTPKFWDQLGKGRAANENWPRSPSVLRSRLRRAAPGLRLKNVEVVFRRSDGARLVDISSPTPAPAQGRQGRDRADAKSPIGPD